MYLVNVFQSFQLFLPLDITILYIRNKHYMHLQMEKLWPREEKQLALGHMANQKHTPVRLVWLS